MKPACRSACRLSPLFLTGVFLSLISGTLAAEQIPLKHAVELALAHGTTMQASQIDEQRAFASYHEARNQYLPQLTVGSGLGKSYGYPLSLEGSAPSIVNTTAQSALINPALRDFVRAAKAEWQESTVQTKDQRQQVIQDTVLSYAELSKWEALMTHLTHQYEDALKMEQIVNKRVLAGVDTPLIRNQARLNAARVYLHISQAQGAIDVLRNRLSQLTGLPATAIETVPESIPELPEVKPEDNFADKAAQESPLIQIADIRATALAFRARGEHRAMLPSIDFAAQYALLATFNNYQNFFRPGSFQQNNATVGVEIRFPFLNPSQHAHAQAADAVALHARKDVEATKNQVSEQTLKLQRSVEQLSAAQQVVDLEYQIAKSNLDTTQTRVDSGSATLHDLDDARNQANERYDALQDTNFELQRARISLLRATGELEDWVGVGK
ncbi:MAG TPA: TolC family protein [Terriglobales bacterium]|nr:TolC family protein [Terriglobales bacterium]